MTNNFLQDNYDKNESLNSSAGKYMKFKIGSNKFRILTSPIVGWEWWENDPEDKGKRRPVRVRLDEKIDISKLEDPDSVKRFWAMAVYNYDDESVQILEITQKGIQNTLKGLARSKDWGTPLGYDVVVAREGEGLETKYEVIPSPPKELSEEVKKAFKEMPINLEALFENDDPFSSTDKGEEFNPTEEDVEG